MALVDMQEQIRDALYDSPRVQFVSFTRIAVDMTAAAAVIGSQGGVDVACANTALGDYLVFGSEDLVEATITPGVPYVAVAGTVRFRFTCTNAAGIDPASHTMRITALRAM